MKRFGLLFALSATLLLCCAFSLKGKGEKGVYAFGVAASFNDTVVYYTEIQLIDSVKLDKNGFLPRQEAYSYQLKSHVEYTLKKPNYTCMIYFGGNRSKLEKESIKLLTNYKKSGVTIERIGKADFTFKKPQE